MNLFDELRNHPAIPPFLSERGHFVVDDSVGISLLLASAFKQKKKKYILVTSNLYKAQKLYSLLLNTLKDEAKIILFPADELIRAETISQSKEMIAHRLYALDKLISKDVDIVIANIASATRYLPSPKLFKESVINLKIGDVVDILEIKKSLAKAGYSYVSKVDASLQFAARGDILDVYSVNNDNPVRIEFFGDEIESIRFFDLATQTSISKINEIKILPANDILFEDEEIAQINDKVGSKLEKDQQIFDLYSFERLRDNVDNDLFKIFEGNYDSSVYKYCSLIQNKHFSIFDYCEEFVQIFVDIEGIKTAHKMMQDESFDYLNELHEKCKTIGGLQQYQDLNRIANLEFSILTKQISSSPKDIKFDVKEIPFIANKESDILPILRNYLNDNYKIVLSMNSHHRLNSVIDILIKNKIPFESVEEYCLPKKHNIGVGLSELGQGFVISSLKIAVFSNKELFNEKVRTSKFDNRFKEASILNNFEELVPGDYIVHEYHGIGQFLEFNTEIKEDGRIVDCIDIGFHGGDILRIPLTSIRLIRKYVGKEGTVPRLSRLNGKDWAKTKEKIKERISDLAERLMKLYIERSKVKGFAFQKDDEFTRDFESRFQHELTYDQAKATAEIKQDMESETPMDRLLCGDVGFGKTEVAFRAAFKAINSGKQVAILCPTTLLAKQHYDLALKRFAKFDIKTALFSRFVASKKQNEYIEGIANGSIHLVIGTHRLLSKNIKFKDLGLFIIDEEQRFGVEQKERLKELKSNIDVLTLSATPIPRTLQISLLGVRSMSVINTPPHDRMPIQTYVTPFNSSIVKELIQRELGRNGQVYYLHNNVINLYSVAARLEKQVPDASVGIVHGQMDKKDIEDVMEKFYNGEIDILVCTSIVENGLDVPNANMIIVEDSDRYGLSQLYQIKGRVGRSDRIAYAYFMYSDGKVLNEKAQKRLQALQEFVELGSGYKIAQRDLLIRGAGDILGPEQAGFIDSIGLDMYIRLLNETVQEKLTGQKAQATAGSSFLNLDAYIPEKFATNEDKILLFQEILTAPSFEALARIKIRLRDNYGKLPKGVENLFIKRNIELLRTEASVEKIIDEDKQLTLVLDKFFLKIRGIGNILFEALIPYLSFMKVSYLNNVFKITIKKRKTWQEDLENILKSLVNIKETNKILEVVWD